MYLPFWDPTIIILLPAIVLAIWAQVKVKKTFTQFSKIANSKGITGAEIARKILDNNGLNKIPINQTRGELTDNYNPVKRTLNLSQVVFGSSSVAAIGVAAHEAGHAIQHKKAYLPLAFRNGIYPVANFGSWLAYPLFFIGLFMGQPQLLKLGIWLFTGFVIFTVITLPVEFNASKRAVKILTNTGYFSTTDLTGVRKVLNAAALTYIAAALSALLNLLRLLLLAGNRD